MTTAPSTATEQAATSSEPDVDPRYAFIAATIGELRDHALSEVSRESVAERAGRDATEMDELFASFPDLLIETIHTWYTQRTTPLMPIAQRHGAVAFLRANVVSNLADPALMRVLSALPGFAATPGHPLALWAQEHFLRFHVVVQRALREDVVVGREPETMKPARGAEQLIALYEGLQVQAMVRPTMDLLASYDRAVTRLRDGWSLTYTPAAFEL
ncbi:hypothetical protein [Amnibacterium endophyticum]|uniref:TetR family transcriptional regulator n=1 Tax=Amnibacterium endophyticum TaxID=2109337 RepID=A0ABW4LD21_9MICO